MWNKEQVEKTYLSKVMRVRLCLVWHHACLHGPVGCLGAHGGAQRLVAVLLGSCDVGGKPVRQPVLAVDVARDDAKYETLLGGICRARHEEGVVNLDGHKIVALLAHTVDALVGDDAASVLDLVKKKTSGFVLEAAENDNQQNRPDQRPQKTGCGTARC
jgi:hypothetical protein